MYSFRMLITLMLLYLCWNCQPATSGYSCIDGNCIPITDNAQYHSLDYCLQNCDTIGYKCENNQCVEVWDSADYTRLQECQNDCL